MTKISYEKACQLLKKKKYEEAFSAFMHLAQSGDVKAQFQLAKIYGAGLGVEADIVNSVKWYKCSAEKGYVNSLFNLAQMYLDGDGVSRSYEVGYSLLRKASNLGDEEAKEQMLEIAEKAFSNGDLLLYINGCEFEDLTAAAMEVAGELDDEMQGQAIDILREKWAFAYKIASANASKQGYDILILSHLSDEIDGKDAYEYLADLRECVDELMFRA